MGPQLPHKMGRATIYAMTYLAMARVARENGWALGLHGESSTILDVSFMPPRAAGKEGR